jgi:mannose-1-phosphate guanylyltransferase/mannose-6-phosphate isomerase
VVTEEGHRFLVQAQLADVGITPAGIILEPQGRNTAAAIGLAAQCLIANGCDELMLVMPSDHLIQQDELLRQAVLEAVPAADDGALVTFGIRPVSPHTGYGYIEAGEPVRDSNGIFAVSRFVEKPTRELAASFIQSGRFFWNAGIFMFRASRYLAELERHAPEVASAVATAMNDSESDGLFVRPAAAAFSASPNISVDYAVMEKTDRALVCPLNLEWSDVGSWAAVWEASEKDGAGNALSGDVIAHDVRNSILRSETVAVVAAIGVEDLAVIVTRDAVLVAPLGRAEEVKTLVQSLQDAGHESVSAPSQVFRPWGSYELMDSGERFQTKRIVVNPGASLSLQKHRHRSEHWVVVTGTAEVTVGEETRLLQENESTYIPAGTVHRLANPGREPLHLIEVQCGSYLGEDDIVRLEDRYGRS